MDARSSPSGPPEPAGYVIEGNSVAWSPAHYQATKGGASVKWENERTVSH